MGDRCWMGVSVRRRDLPRFTEILLGEKSDNPEDAAAHWEQNDTQTTAGFMEVSDCGVNYGAGDLREAAAEEGLVFFGSHGSGGEYGPCIFAAVDGKQIEADTNMDGGFPVVETKIGADGELVPVASSLANARAYHQAIERAKLRARESELIETLGAADLRAISTALLLYREFCACSSTPIETWVKPIIDQLHAIETDAGNAPGLTVKQLDDLGERVSATLDDRARVADHADD